MWEGAEEMALEILRLYRGAETEGWDLHAFFELAAGDDPERRTAVLDIVDRLTFEGYLESRGSDFYTLTAKGRRAAQEGRLRG
jgi:DNA-binding PadR family transcriptional regulator